MNAKLKSTIAVALMSCVMATGAATAQTKSKPKPKQPHCYDVEVQRPKQVKDKHKITGTALGAVAGGLLGNQVGGGSGKVATAAGAVGGALVGRKIQENQQNKTETVIERRCD